MENIHNTTPANDAGNPLELEGAFRLLADVANGDERGLLCDYATEGAQINRVRAAFAQVRGQLLELESDFETHVSQEVERLHSEMQSITNRGRN